MVEELERLGLASQLPVTAEDRALDLHCKIVEPMAIESFDDDHVRKVVSWTTNAKHYEGAELETQPQRVDLQPGDVDKYLAAKYLKKVPKGTVKNFCRVFTTVERKKKRRRFILWPRKTNRSLRPVNAEGDTLPQMEDLFRFILDNERSSTLDMPQGFCQVPLHEDVQPYFGFEYQGQEYVMTVLPMGFTKSVEILQTILTFAARTHPAKVWVDGIWTTANPQFVQEQCKAHGIQIAVEQADASRIEFHGFIADHAKKTVELTVATQIKLGVAFTALHRPDCTWRQARSAMGRIFNATWILGIALFDAYYLVKWYRRRCAQAPEPSAPARCWQRALEDATALNHAIASFSLRKLKKEPSVYHALATDASKKGWGAVLFRPQGTFVTTGGSWSTTEAERPIHELEMEALGLALAHFKDEVKGKALDVKIDNTSGVASLRKQRSNSFGLNAISGRIQKLLSDTVADYKVSYVATELNPADERSRLRETSSPKAKKFFEEIEWGQPIRSVGGAGRISAVNRVLR